MTLCKNFIFIILAVSLLVLICPLQALSDDNAVNVIYQTSFASDPHWTTNNPSTDYWDPNMAMYHFSIEPSTGGYAYTTINYERGPFTFEYDVNLTRVDEGATFRFGMSGSEMDLSKAPNVLTQFTNGKNGQIMMLHLVTPGSKLLEVSSQTSNEPLAYSGPSVKYQLNTLYHVTVNYDNDRKTLNMKVNEKLSGKEIWSYYLTATESLNGMNRIYLGSKGDYGVMNIYAQGYIDNVRLTQPAAVTTSPTAGTHASFSATPSTTKQTTQQTTAASTQMSSETPASSSTYILAIGALSISVIFSARLGKKKN